MLKQMRTFLLGESYWKVVFQSGRELSELDTFTFSDGTTQRVRDVEWLEDVIGAMELRNVREAMLYTPRGTAHFTVTEPYTVFQFSRGTQVLIGDKSERIKNMQCVGVVTDQETGDCECVIWDMQTKQLYTLFNNVRNFTAWREGVADIGLLNLSALDLRGVAVV